MGCTEYLLAQAYLMTSWQAESVLVRAIPFGDPFKTSAHTADGRTHLICFIVGSQKNCSEKNPNLLLRHQSSMFLLMAHFMSGLMSLAILGMKCFCYCIMEWILILNIHALWMFVKNNVLTSDKKTFDGNMNWSQLDSDLLFFFYLS